MRIFALLAAALLPALAAPPDAGKGKTLGDPKARVVMELYSDFMCPHCKHLHETILPQIEADFVKTGKAYLIFRDIPLAIPGHVYSRPAAVIASAAARVGKYREVSDALFRGQTSWGMTGRIWDFVAPALSADDLKRVQALADDPGTAADVQRDYDLSQTERISQTPTMLVTYKGKKYPWIEWGDYSLFKGLVNDLLKK